MPEFALFFYKTKKITKSRYHFESLNGGKTYVMSL